MFLDELFVPGGADAPPNAFWPTSGIFLILAFVITIVAILTAKNMKSALAQVGGVASILFISTQLREHIAPPCRAVDAWAAWAAPPMNAKAVPFYPPPAGGETSTAGSAGGAGYRGAIDFDLDGLDSAPEFGASDRLAGAEAGNPHNLGRYARPAAAPPCVDEEAAAIYDGDEQVTYQSRARNQPERVWAGASRRKTHVSGYVDEELDEEENAPWWGRSEQ
jgi:hypothetical protein